MWPLDLRFGRHPDCGRSRPLFFTGSDYHQSGSNVDAIQKNIVAYVKKHIRASSSNEKSPANEGEVKMVIDHVSVKGGKSMTVPLPDIHLKDIGKKEEGASSGEVAKSIIGALNKAILKAVAPLNLDKVGEVAGKAIEGTKDAVEGVAKGVTDAVSNIFGK